MNTFSKRAVGWVSPVLDGARRTGETACCDLAGDLAGDLAILSKQILCDSDFLKNMLKNANIVGQNVVIFRHKAGWTQDVLAAKIQLLGCYMSRDIIANIETRRWVNRPTNSKQRSVDSSNDPFFAFMSKLVLPNSQHAPALHTQRPSHESISCLVA